MTGGPLYCRILSFDRAWVEYEPIYHREDGSERIGSPRRLPIGGFIEGESPDRSKESASSLRRWESRTLGKLGGALTRPEMSSTDISPIVLPAEAGKARTRQPQAPSHLRAAASGMPAWYR